MTRDATSMEPELLAHGGNLAVARACYGEPDQGWIDLSTGINPYAYPLVDLSHEAWTRLPQADGEAELITAARSAYGVAPRASVLAAPGTQILIQLVARLRTTAHVAVICPTYSEHSIAWAREGATVAHVTSLDAALQSGADVIVCVNPNNPDGRVIPRCALLEAADTLAQRGGLLVVDEAFADVCPQVSVADHTDRPGVIALRSFGKFFGLAGLRLGFALGPVHEIERLRGWLGPWATPGPAIEIGQAALSDQAWQSRMRAAIVGQADRLVQVLVAAGFEIVGEAGLFVLAEHRDAADRYAALVRSGVLTRRFQDHPTWLRFGLPDDSGLARLKTAFGLTAIG